MDSHARPLPRHVAIIMDGNGRWAKQRGWRRPLGHREGAERVDEIVTACCELKIPFLTLYAFSTENWNRPESEITFLMDLLVDFLRKRREKLLRNRVALHAIGTLERLSPAVQEELQEGIAATYLPNPDLHLALALSYGGRQEILHAVQAIAKEALAQGEGFWDHFGENDFRKFLYNPSFPDPDLVIRTGGEYRMSNFLLWQSAYSEFYVAEPFWPDFGRKEFDVALRAYQQRERRFGHVDEQLPGVSSVVQEVQP